MRSKRLSDNNRKSYIDQVLVLLKALNKNSIEGLTKDDFEKFLRVYREANKEDAARSYLAALYSVIANGIGFGILKENPFDDFLMEKRVHRSREDFIMPEQMDKILNLDSLNWKDSGDVRRRLVTLFLYDTGMRASSFD